MFQRNKVESENWLLYKFMLPETFLRHDNVLNYMYWCVNKEENGNGILGNKCNIKGSEEFICVTV